MKLVDIVRADPLDGFGVRLTFLDGTVREIDLWPYMCAGAIFAPLREDPTFFRRVEVQDGTITWPNGADIDPNVLYYPDLSPAVWE